MNDRDRQEQELQLHRRARLFEELWPVPEPPRNLAAQVVARLHRGATPTTITHEVEAVTVLPPRRLRPRVLAAAGVFAAAAAIGLWLARPGSQGGADAGQVLARASQTVSIGTRAAAAVEVGTELAWSVRDRQTRVDQRRGSVLYRVRRGGPFRVITPAGDVEVTGTSFRVTMAPNVATAASTLVTVLEGSVKVHSGAGTRALIAGQTARLAPDRAPELMAIEQPVAPVTAAGPSAAPPERPAAPSLPASRAPGRAPAALLLPHAERLQVHATRLREVSLALPPGRPAAAVQVARDARFTRPIWQGPAAGFVTVPAPARGDLYWRVGEGPVAHAHFRPERPAPRGLASPRNLVTQQRESTTIYFQSTPPALTLAWAEVPGARSYRVRLTRASAPQRLVLERLVTEPRCAVAPGTLGEGSYLWTVLPVDASAAVAPATAARRLDLVYDNAVSALTIHQPRPGASLRGPAIDVQGVAPLGARLFVNGKAAAVDDKGRFSMRVPRTARTLIFRVLEKDGAESYWVRPLASGS